jgi:PmbA protein
MSQSEFSYSYDQLRDRVADTLVYARRQGADAVEVEASEGVGMSVTVRQQALETIEFNRDKGVTVTVYLGQRKGNASTADFSAPALRDTVNAALDIARFTAPDPCAGLPDESLLSRSAADLDLHHPWSLAVDRAAELARRCESAAFAVSDLVSNSEGASLSTQIGQFCLGSSQGFIGGYPGSRHYIACSVIAGSGDAMQREDWYSTARDPGLLADPESIGDYAARRALSRLGARRIKTCQVPVIFEAPLACSLLGNFVHAASGGSLYRNASFLRDRLGQRVFSPAVSIDERPHLRGALASAPFDNDGVATADRSVVADGVLEGYFLSTYSGRKLGLPTTGNAGGCHNLIVRPGLRDLEAMIAAMGRGLLVTELLGHGVNYVNGDYSRGAAGYWVENGRIAHPVEEITIAGNLKEMFSGVVETGSDVIVRGSKQTGSWWIDRMTVAGA